MLVPMGSSDDFLRGRLAAILSAVRSGSNRLPPSLRGAKRRSNPACRLVDLRGACHRARIRATRWLAMTFNPTKKPPRGLFPIHIIGARSVRVGPDLLLGEIHQSREYDQEN